MCEVGRLGTRVGVGDELHTGLWSPRCREEKDRILVHWILMHTGW